MQRKNFEETKLRVMQLISLSNEFCDKVGREIDIQEKTFAAWMFMDDDTKSRAEKRSWLKAPRPLPGCATSWRFL